MTDFAAIAKALDLLDGVTPDEIERTLTAGDHFASPTDLGEALAILAKAHEAILAKAKGGEGEGGIDKTEDDEPSGEEPDPKLKKKPKKKSKIEGEASPPEGEPKASDAEDYGSSDSLEKKLKRPGADPSDFTDEERDELLQRFIAKHGAPPSPDVTLPAPKNTIRMTKADPGDGLDGQVDALRREAARLNRAMQSAGAVTPATIAKLAGASAELGVTRSRISSLKKRAMKGAARDAAEDCFTSPATEPVEKQDAAASSRLLAQLREESARLTRAVELNEAKALVEKRQETARLAKPVKRSRTWGQMLGRDDT